MLLPLRLQSGLCVVSQCRTIQLDPETVPSDVMILLRNIEDVVTFELRYGVDRASSFLRAWFYFSPNHIEFSRLLQHQRDLNEINAILESVRQQMQGKEDDLLNHERMRCVMEYFQQTQRFPISAKSAFGLHFAMSISNYFLAEELLRRWPNQCIKKFQWEHSKYNKISRQCARMLLEHSIRTSKLCPENVGNMFRGYRPCFNVLFAAEETGVLTAQHFTFASDEALKSMYGIILHKFSDRIDNCEAFEICTKLTASLMVLDGDRRDLLPKVWTLTLKQLQRLLIENHFKKLIKIGVLLNYVKLGNTDVVNVIFVSKLVVPDILKLANVRRFITMHISSTSMLKTLEAHGFHDDVGKFTFDTWNSADPSDWIALELVDRGLIPTPEQLLRLTYDDFSFKKLFQLLERMKERNVFRSEHAKFLTACFAQSHYSSNNNFRKLLPWLVSNAFPLLSIGGKISVICTALLTVDFQHLDLLIRAYLK